MDEKSATEQLLAIERAREERRKNRNIVLIVLAVVGVAFAIFAIIGIISANNAADSYNRIVGLGVETGLLR